MLHLRGVVRPMKEYIVNPRRMRRRVMVVVLCVCLSVCLSVNSVTAAYFVCESQARVI